MKEKKSLFSRQMLLLALLQRFGGKLSKIDLQKYLFLFTEICEKEKSYEFVPYQYGCFSFQSYADRRRLVEVGAIVESNNWQLANDDDYISQIPQQIRNKLEMFYNKFKSVSGDDLVKYIYRTYPYYAINSKIAQEKMTAEEMSVINAAKPVCEDYAFFTIGYEGHSFENYLNRLIMNNIKVLCDVRKNPLSRKYGFSKTTLSETLKNLGIKYIHIPELGIVSEERQELKTQKDYDRLFDKYEANTLKQNLKALDQLESIFMKDKRIAITCFEKDHCMCHRGRVAKAMNLRIKCWGKVVHI